LSKASPAARVGQRAVLELVDRDVRGEVVDAVQRFAEGQRERLRRRDPDQQRAGEPGPGGHRNRVHVVQRHARGVAGTLQRGDHRLEMGPRGHLGHDPAEPGVLLDRGGDGVGQQRVPADEADPGLVARGLDAEDEGFAHPDIVPGDPSPAPARLS
jgi:hypothetical protein